MNIERPTRLEINLDAAQYNLQQIKKQRSGQKIMCIVKGNAYGHGIEAMAKFYQSQSVDYLGVAIPEEGVVLRAAGIHIPILVLSAIGDYQIPLCIDHDLTMTVPSDEKLRSVNRAAKSIAKPARVHIKIDTGMGRIGVHWSRVEKMVSAIQNSPHVHVEGFFSHLATSEPDSELFQAQMNHFQSALEVFSRAQISFDYIHIANSGAVLFQDRFPVANMFRAGIILYGLCENTLLKSALSLQPIMQWKTKVVYFKFVEKGTGIGYGHADYAPTGTRIVTLSVGYADGYRRDFGKQGQVIIRGKKYPIIGRVCMDQMMVDIGPEGESYCGDDVVLIGTDENQNISVNDIARQTDSSIYEIVTQISLRVARVYVSDLGLV